MSTSPTRCLQTHLKVSSVLLSLCFPIYFSCFCFKTCLDVFVNWNFFSNILQRVCRSVFKVLDKKQKPSIFCQIFGAKPEWVCETLLLTWYIPKYSISLYSIFAIIWQSTPIYTYCLDLPLLPCFSYLSSYMWIPLLRAADIHCTWNTSGEKTLCFLHIGQNSALVILIKYRY